MRLIFSALVLITLAGCHAFDTLTDGVKHSQEVAADMESAIGTKPAVGFNWSNGSLTSVSISFTGVPPKASPEQIAEVGKRSIATRFEQAPQQVVISFIVPGH